MVVNNHNALHGSFIISGNAHASGEFLKTLGVFGKL
jgi:hypothetical protein